LRSELRRVSRALAARTAFARVDFAFGGDAPGTSSFKSGKGGSNGAGIVALRSMGCMFMGPACRGLRICIQSKRVDAEFVRLMDRAGFKPLSRRLHGKGLATKGSIVFNE